MRTRDGASLSHRGGRGRTSRHHTGQRAGTVLRERHTSRARRSTGRSGHKPRLSEHPDGGRQLRGGRWLGSLMAPSAALHTSDRQRQTSAMFTERNSFKPGEEPGASPDQHGVPGVAAVILRGLLQRLEVEVLQGREHASAPHGRVPGAPHAPQTPPLTRLPHTSSSISSGLNRYFSGDSLVTMWKPLRKALNCFSTDLLRM